VEGSGEERPELENMKGVERALRLFERSAEDATTAPIFI
jgi:hypothetical protein